MSERQSKLAMFNVINVVPPSTEPYSLPSILILSFVVIILFIIIISRVLYLKHKKTLSLHSRVKAVPLYFSKHSVNIPKGLYYDKTHTWAFMEKDGLIKIGIDDFLQHVTGPITRIEMRKPGEKVRKGDMILTIIQNGKRLVVFAPLSGIIKENNGLLNSQFTLINSSPYSDGWIYRIEPANWLRELQLMEMAEKYQAWLSNEFLRLKDFLAGSLKVNKMEYEAIVLQDGGMLKDGVLEDFGPEVWEDFQSNFLDTTY
jgi:glycine cleavage system H lipoate-binding protein